MRNTENTERNEAAGGAPVTMYTTRFCPFCIAARQLLGAKGVAFEDIAVDGDPELRRQMAERAGQRTVPQIWIGETHVGGYTDLAGLEQSGELDRLLDAGPDRDGSPG